MIILSWACTRLKVLKHQLYFGKVLEKIIQKSLIVSQRMSVEHLTLLCGPANVCKDLQKNVVTCGPDHLLMWSDEWAVQLWSHHSGWMLITGLSRANVTLYGTLKWSPTWYVVLLFIREKKGEDLQYYPNCSHHKTSYNRSL